MSGFWTFPFSLDVRKGRAVLCSGQVQLLCQNKQRRPRGPQGVLGGGSSAGRGAAGPDQGQRRRETGTILVVSHPPFVRGLFLPDTSSRRSECLSED